MMKLYTFLALIAVTVIFAQAPQGFNYQATVRNSAGALIVNQNVLVKFNIYQNTATGTIVYSENQSVTSDDLGHINLVVGQGTSTTGTFSTINWSTGNYYLGIELNSGNGFVDMGTTQLLSVPYALFAQTAETTSSNNQNLQDVLDNGNFALTDLVTSPNNHAILLNSKGGSDPNAFYRGINSVLNNQTGQTLNGQIRAIQSSAFGPNTGSAIGVATFVSDANSTTGVLGQVQSSSNYTNQLQKIGVNGVSINTSNANSWGVVGLARDSQVRNIGVGAYCTNGNTITGNNYGLYANVNSVTSTGNNYGIYSTVANGVNNYAGYFDGNIVLTGTLIQPSDKKFKREIKPLYSALEKINQLTPVSYYYVNNNSNINLPNELQYGFIAQDLQRVFPELVFNQTIDVTKLDSPKLEKSGIKDIDESLIFTTVSNTNIDNKNLEKEEFKGINYTGLISILTEGIKEQQVLIEELKKQNELLTKRINIIENKLK